LLQSVANGIGALLLRRQADFAQRDSRARLTATLAAMPDLVLEMDHDDEILPDTLLDAMRGQIAQMAAREGG
jgi:hypothetical protein